MTTGPEAQAQALTARGLEVRGGGRRLLHGIDLALDTGEFTGLLGGSGAGKSVLMTALCGFRGVDEGAILHFGKPLGSGASDLIGYVPQDDLVHKHLDIQAALEFAIHLWEEEPGDVSQRISSVLATLGLEEHRHKTITKLSGGQRKRVSIALELLHSPRLFFLDEPTAGLDPALEKQLMQLMATLARDGRMVMASTHLMQHIHLFDQLVFIHKGRLIWFGPHEEILDYFQARDMVHLYERIDRADPDMLARRYQTSPAFATHLRRRLDGV